MALSPLEQGTLARFSRELQNHFGSRLRAVQLFGSRARGEGRDDSDLDVVVRIEHLTREERRYVQDFASDLSVETRLILAPVVVDERKWAESGLRPVVEREGILL